jgi:hypothetical protein
MATSSTSLPPGWYVVRTTTGKVGIVLHHQLGAILLGPASNGTATQAVPISSNTSDSLPSLLGSHSAAIQAALKHVGANAQQSATFITQADTASGKLQGQPEGGIWGFVTGLVGATPTTSTGNTTQLLIGSEGQPSAWSGKKPVSTTPSGDVQDEGSSLPGLPDWEQFLVRVLEGLVGVALIFLGLQALTGTGSQGNPVQAVSSAAKYAKYVR